MHWLICICQYFILWNTASKTQTYFIPPSSLIFCVLKLQCAPAPFQSPGMGLGSNVTLTPKSSATRCKRKRAIHKWSPMLIPSQGPTWNSHWKQSKTYIIWPRREKTCLRDFCQSEFQTGLLSYRDYLENWNLICTKFITYATFQKANNKGADQTARMCRLVCACVVRKPPKTSILETRSI